MDSKSTWREFVTAQTQNTDPQFDMRIAIAGSMTVQPLEPYLGANLLRKTFKPQITIGPFNQLWQICYNHQSLLGTGDLNAITLLWRLEDLYPDLLARCVSDSSAVGDLLRDVKGLVDAVDAF